MKDAMAHSPNNPIRFTNLSVHGIGRFRALALTLAAVCLAGAARAAVECRLVRDGTPLPVVVSPAADASVRNSAGQLTNLLARMLGQVVPLETGDGRQGLAVGFPGDFPALREKLYGDRLPERWDESQNLAQAQRYVLVSHAEGVAIVGATQLAVEYAVWDFLYRLGYRYFFPSKTWEVVPKLSQGQAVVSLDEDETPDYFDRRLWGAMTPEWSFRNRMSHHGWRTNFRPAMDNRWKVSPINTHHMYQAIIQFNKEEFEQHPEYYALVNGERRGTKLCISNPNVPPLALRYARDRLARNSASLSISMEPTDGYGWCECEACQELGSPSTRMIHLANAVARGLEETHPHVLLGVLAYAHHAEPPAIEVHPKIAVQCATQLSGKIPFEERLAGWSAKAATVGVYEYYGVTQWHRSLPGRMKGGNLAVLRKTIPAFHALGARMMNAESGDSWGGNGLGHVVAARLLWDVDTDADAVIEDFLIRSFGSAAAPMRRFYDLMDASRNVDTAGDLKPGSLEYFEDRAVRMYATLLEARGLAGEDRTILARLDDLLLYARYVQLWCANRRAKADAQDEALQRLVRFAYQIRETRMVHWGLLRQFIAGANKVDLKSPPPWLDEEQKAAFDPAPWARVTPALIEATWREAAGLGTSGK